MFAIYFPGRAGCNLDHFHDAGLSDLLDDQAPQFADLQPGPDHGRGVAACWSKELFRGPDQCDWTEIQIQNPKSKIQNPIWLGRAKGRKPTPADFARGAQQLGSEVVLADGHAWEIPVARQLPQLLALGGDGRWAGQVAPNYRAFWEAAWKTLDWFVPGDDGRCSVDFQAGAEFVSLALSINYRANRVIASWLGLIRSDLFWPVARAVTEFDELLSASAKKNEEQASAGRLTSAGASG